MPFLLLRSPTLPHVKEPGHQTQAPVPMLWETQLQVMQSAFLVPKLFHKILKLFGVITRTLLS